MLRLPSSSLALPDAKANERLCLPSQTQRKALQRVSPHLYHQTHLLKEPDEESQVGNLARAPGNPLLFAISALGSLMTTVSQDLDLTSHPKDGSSYSTVSPSLHWGIGILLIRTRGKTAPYWPTNTTSSSNLVFP